VIQYVEDPLLKVPNLKREIEEEVHYSKGWGMKEAYPSIRLIKKKKNAGTQRGRGKTQQTGTTGGG